MSVITLMGIIPEEERRKTGSVLSARVHEPKWEGHRFRVDGSNVYPYNNTMIFPGDVKVIWVFF